MNRSLERKDDYKFSTAKDPLFNSNGFCKVEDHCRQEHRCDCVCTDRSLSMLEQRLKRAVQKGLPGLFSSRKTEMSVKGTECSELCGVVYFKPSVLNHTQENKGLVYIQCMLAKKEDVRDILDWITRWLPQIVNMLHLMLVDPKSFKKRQHNKRALVSHCHFTFCQWIYTCLE